MASIHLRFPTEEFHQTIKSKATKNRRTLNGEIIHAIEFYLEHAPEAQREVKPEAKEVKKKISKSP